MDENKNLNDNLNENTENLDFDSLEAQLENELEDEMSELRFLESERKNIGSPDALGETIINVVWEQFLNQIAVTAGEDFIKENRGLTLDLRSEAHIQTTENFANGKIATHNTEIDYQQRYDDWQSNFQRNEDGSIRMRKDPRTGEMKAVLRVRDRKKDPNGENYNTNYNAREPFDKNRPKGSAQENIDEVISVAEQLRDPAANAHMTKEELVAFDNSEKNLNPMDSAANQSKGDSTMSEFLDSERNGQKPAERFNIDEEALRKKDAEAREEYEKLKKEAEQRSIEAGKKSRRDEAKRIGGKALRAVVMQLLADLIKEIIGQLVKWFKDTKKSFDSFIESIKNAIKSFVSKLKEHLINVGNTLITTIATAIIGPVVGTIKKVWMMLKQGWQSIKNAIAFLKDPNNQTMPASIKVLEVGKIVMAGLSGIGAITLGEVIEKALIAIPGAGAFFSFEIPLIGSLANILGIFLGAVVAGIIGAIVINLIDKAIANRQKEENSYLQIEKGNEILNKQSELISIKEAKLEKTKSQVQNNIHQRDAFAKEILKETSNERHKSMDNIENRKKDIARLLSSLQEN